MAISQEKKKEQSLNIESIAWGDLTWVNIERPTEREIEYLAKNYSFHRLDLDDCLSRIQRPKMDVYEDYLFLIFHFSVYSKLTRVSTHDQLSVFVGDKYLITLHSGQLKALVEFFKECQINEQARQQSFSRRSGYLLYCILDRMVDSYFPILDKILSIMDDVEDTVFDETVDAAQELAILRRDVIAQRRIVFPNRTTIAQLEGKLQRFATIDMSVYFGDLMDHMNKICETLDECKEIIEVYKDTDFVLGTDRINRVMRVLTILSTIVLPFLVVSSLYGMNVHMPGGITSGSWVPFILIMLVVTLITGVMLYFFHRKRWI